MAGLTAAAFLSRAGHKVLLAEKNDRCGGLVGSFTRDGFRFDTGIRAFEDAGIIAPTLDELGISVDFIRSKVSVGIEDQILDIATVESLPAYRDMLARLYPDSAPDISRIMGVIRTIMKHMRVLYGIENPIIKGVSLNPRYLLGELLPWALKFLLTMRKINRLDYPVEEFLERMSDNRSLRDIISQHFFKCTPTFFAMSYFSLYLDYIYPRGGTGVLPSSIADRITACGGEIATGTEIHRIRAADSVAYDQNGQEYSYRTLVWAADLKTLYRVTDTGDLPDNMLGGIEQRRAGLFERRGGDSVFILFLAVDEPPETFARISRGHFFYTPSRSGLGETHRGDLRRLLRTGDHVSREDVRGWLTDFCRLSTYEISIPVLNDARAAPPGKTGMIVSVLFEYDLMKMVDEAGWYTDFRREIEDQIIRALADSIYPMLRTKVLSRFSSTPLTIERSMACSDGAITGWSFEEPVPVVNRIASAPRAVTTPIPNVLQAGQWTYSPAGVPMCILTGKLAADRALKTLRR